MSQPITEIVQLKLQPDAKFEEQMPEFTRILERQPGFVHLAWGRWSNWDKIESHHLFEKSGDDYAALGVIVKSFAAEKPLVYHVNFKPQIGVIASDTSAA